METFKSVRQSVEAQAELFDTAFVGFLEVVEGFARSGINYYDAVRRDRSNEDEDNDDVVLDDHDDDDIASILNKTTSITVEVTPS